MYLVTRFEKYWGIVDQFGETKAVILRVLPSESLSDVQHVVDIMNAGHQKEKGNDRKSFDSTVVKKHG